MQAETPPTHPGQIGRCSTRLEAVSLPRRPRKGPSHACAETPSWSAARSSGQCRPRDRARPPEIFEIEGGRVEGPDIKGRLLGGGGDWILVGADGFGRLDVRGQLMTDDGAAIYVQYFGILEMNDAVMRNLADPSKATEYADQYFRTTPRLETGDSRYAWVNRTVFVAEGRMPSVRGVEYRVYRVL